MDWRKYDLVERGKGRYRLERQTWSFWDWCLMLFVVAVVARFWWWVLAAAVVIAIGMALVVVAGVVLAFVSRKQ